MGVLNRLILMLPQPRPTNSILVAMIVTNWRFASSGKLVMHTTARATCSTTRVGSTAIRPMPGVHPEPFARSSQLRHYRYRFGHTQYRICAHRATSTWSARSSHASSRYRRIGTPRMGGDRAIVDDAPAPRLLRLHNAEGLLCAQERDVALFASARCSIVFRDGACAQ
jgi:hypothetical protein